MSNGASADSSYHVHLHQKSLLLVSQWLMFNANWEIFPAISWRQNFFFDEMMMLFGLHRQISFIVLGHWNYSRWEIIMFQIFSWHRVNLYLLILLIAVCLGAVGANTNYIVFGMGMTKGCSKTRFTALEASMQSITLPMRLMLLYIYMQPSLSGNACF